MGDEDGQRDDAILETITGVDAQIGREERILEHIRTAQPVEETAAVREPVITGGTNRAATQAFACFGEQMACLYNARTGHMSPRRQAQDLERLVHVHEGVSKDAAYTGPSGANESNSSDGGFFVQRDIAAPMLESAVTNGLILGRTNRVTVAGDGLKMLTVDESSVASTVWGGVLAYWRAEAGQMTPTKSLVEPRGVKLQLINSHAGTATYGRLATDAGFWTHWAPLPTFSHDNAAHLGDTP
jgi:HK97 family phage major capsid protein